MVAEQAYRSNKPPAFSHILDHNFVFVQLDVNSDFTGSLYPCLYLLQVSAFVFTPTEKEQKDQLLHVRYVSSKDQYCRVSSCSETIQNWDQCVWDKESVFRKVENDWQMVSLVLFIWAKLVLFIVCLTELLFLWKRSDHSSFCLRLVNGMWPTSAVIFF